MATRNRVAGSAFTSEAEGTPKEVSIMHAAELTLHAKPDNFEQVAEIYSEFATSFLSDHPALQTVLVLGDEASGVVRGVGVYTDREAADEVNSDPEFASFNERVGPLLASPPERLELKLLHHYSS
jgi:quinol monooxygenase YgiN